jgi:hypothetical protein
MLDDRPQTDRILAAQLDGTAKHHARWRELTEAEHARRGGGAAQAGPTSWPRPRVSYPIFAITPG